MSAKWGLGYPRSRWHEIISRYADFSMGELSPRCEVFCDSEQLDWTEQVASMAFAFSLLSAGLAGSGHLASYIQDTQYLALRKVG